MPSTARNPTGRRRSPCERCVTPSCLLYQACGDGGVELVRAGRADAFVLVIDPRRRIERFLQAARANQRRRTPLRINLPHLSGNLDLALGADFLNDQGHGKQRSEIGRAERLERAGMQWRRERLGQIGKNVVPGLRNTALRQIELNGLHAQHFTGPHAHAAGRRGPQAGWRHVAWITADGEFYG